VVNTRVGASRIGTEASGTPSIGRREIRKEATRRQLILAGRRLFSEVGLYEARIEDLTEIAGIAKGTMYLYFRNKDELAQAVVAAGYRDLRARVEECSSGAHSFPVVVRRIVRAHAEFFARNPDLMRIFHQGRGMLKFDRPQWRGLRAPLRDHIAFLAETLRRASSGPRRSDTARRRMALALFGCVSGVASVQTALEPHKVARAFERALVSNLSSLAYIWPRTSSGKHGRTR